MRYLSAIIGGILMTALMSWLFAIEWVPLQRWQEFPDQWRLFEVVTQLFLIFCFIGATSAILKGFREYDKQKKGATRGGWPANQRRSKK